MTSKDTEQACRDISHSLARRALVPFPNYSGCSRGKHFGSPAFFIFYFLFCGFVPAPGNKKLKRKESKLNIQSLWLWKRKV